MRKRRTTGGGALKSGFGFSGFGAHDQFIELTDCPASYAGQANKVLSVNPAETGVQFIPGRGVVNGLASLDATGKVPNSELPSLAISDFLGVVASQVVMLALTGERGDWCIRSDTGTTFVAINEPLSVIGNWQEYNYPSHLMGGAYHVADTIANIQTKVSDGSLITTAAGEINSITEKDPITPSDIVVIEDANDAWKKKKVQISNIQVPSFLFYADQLDSPNNADWPINALAPVDVDSVNNALKIRTFDDTVEQGIGFMIRLPEVNITYSFMRIEMIGRAQTAPGTSKQVELKLYRRLISDNAALGAWNAGINLTPLGILTNAYYRYSLRDEAFITHGITVGGTYQFELTRNSPDTTNDTLTGNWNLLELRISFV